MHQIKKMDTRNVNKDKSPIKNIRIQKPLLMAVFFQHYTKIAIK